MARGMRGKSKEKKKKGESSSSPPSQVWRPGIDTMEEGEELQYDPSAYNCLHAFSLGWPCLSFDMVPDNRRYLHTEFPHTVYGVAGTQANQKDQNYIGIFKLSNIVGKKRDLLPALSVDNGSDMDSDSSSDDEDDESSQPVLQLHKVAHQGGINRIRSKPQSPHVCATWAEMGHVQVWDFASHLEALSESETEVSRGGNSMQTILPIRKFDGHKDEGYALDWSPRVDGRLISGDCNGYIHLWEHSSGTWEVDINPFVGHTASVEDMQWSPSDDNIFASCSADGTIAIWDTGTRKSPVLSVRASNSHINVISWNRLEKYLLASGSDDGTVLIHDLRLFERGKFLERVKPLSYFDYHKQAITSIEWSPHESSTFAVTSEDHQLTIWDLGLEKDEEQEAELKTKMKQEANAPDDLPPHLLFVHQGQKNLKELHWHPRIDGMLISTAEDGFNVLMPANL